MFSSIKNSQTSASLNFKVPAVNNPKTVKLLEKESTRGKTQEEAYIINLEQGKKYRRSKKKKN